MDQQQASAAATQTKPVPPAILNVGLLFRYFCPLCGKEAVGQDAKELLEGNDYSVDIPAWSGKCRHCKQDVATLPIAASYFQNKPKDSKSGG